MKVAPATLEAHLSRKLMRGLIVSFTPADETTSARPIAVSGAGGLPPGAAQYGRKNAGNRFAGRGGKLLDASKQVKRVNDFERITWLAIK